MADALKPAGKAVATARGHYPQADGRHVTIVPGQTFTVWEGMTKAKWFTLLPAKGPAPEQPKKQAEAPGPDTLSAAAGAERQRKASGPRPPTEDPQLA